MSTQKTFYPTHPTNEPSLSNEEAKAAKDELVRDVNKFPSINRRFVDPPVAGEPKFALFSYIENEDVDMNKFHDEIMDSLKPKHKKKLAELKSRTQLMKGVGKIRGAYVTQQEADTRAEEIVRDIDSSNSVFTCIVGIPFPLVSEGNSQDVNEVDLTQETENAITQNVRKQRQKSKKEMDEIKRREEELMRNAEKDPNADDEDNYIAQRVKLAHLRYSIEQHIKKHAECVNNESKVVEWLVDMNNRNPEFEEKYQEKYMAGRKAAHIPDDHDPEGFMKYMNDPLIKLDVVKKEEDDQ